MCVCLITCLCLTYMQDATIKHGWRTGAIIPELESEISSINGEHFKHTLRWMIALEQLIQKQQVGNQARTETTG